MLYQSAERKSFESRSRPYSSANTQHRARNSKKGKYDVNSTATMGTMSANATTSFVVN